MITAKYLAFVELEVTDGSGLRAVSESGELMEVCRWQLNTMTELPKGSSMMEMIITHPLKLSVNSGTEQ